MTLCSCSRRQYRKNYRAAIDSFLYEHRTWTCIIKCTWSFPFHTYNVRRLHTGRARISAFCSTTSVMWNSLRFFPCTTQNVDYLRAILSVPCGHCRIGFAAFSHESDLNNGKYGKSTATEVSGANVESKYKCLLLFIYYPPHSFVHFPFYFLILPQCLMPIFILFLT